MMKKNKFIIIVGIVAAFLLAFFIFSVDNIPENAGNEASFNAAQTAQPTIAPSVEEEVIHPQNFPEEKDDISEEEAKSDIERALHDEAYSNSLAANQPIEEANDDVVSLVCTLSVSCKSVLENPEEQNDVPKDILPQNGMIFEEKTVEFFEDESVFDVLLREMENSNIPFEFNRTPMYNSVYIEGIGNLYEFDCGDSSGWLYRVNGVKPTFGCSQYKLKNGDKIEFYYSCNFLEDSK